MGCLYSELRHVAEAIAVCRDASALAPEPLRGLTQVIGAYDAVGPYDQARMHCRVAMIPGSAKFEHRPYPATSIRGFRPQHVDYGTSRSRCLHREADRADGTVAVVEHVAIAIAGLLTGDHSGKEGLGDAPYGRAPVAGIRMQVPTRGTKSLTGPGPNRC